MQYLFGPVNSRRLGLSLGIDLIPLGICTQNCVYCEAGPKQKLTCERKEYSPTREIIAEFDAFCSEGENAVKPDVYTVTAKGEPTLHTGIGEIIRHVRGRVANPVVVLTNGTLLHLPEVRHELMAADIVVPSLDAARPESYDRVNRPHRCASLNKLLTGLRLFSREFTGQLWLEILLVKGCNDSDDDIVAFNHAIEEIAPSRVQLNTVVRPPLDPLAKPLSREDLERIAARLRGNIEIIAYPSEKTAAKKNIPAAQDILAMLERRPCTAADLGRSFGLDPRSVSEILHQFEQEERITLVAHDGILYYTMTNKGKKFSTGTI